MDEEDTGSNRHLIEMEVLCAKQKGRITELEARLWVENDRGLRTYDGVTTDYENTISRLRSALEKTNKLLLRYSYMENIEEIREKNRELLWELDNE